MPRPRKYDDEKRVAVLGAAAAAIARDGFDGLSLRVLAAECGVSTQVLYSMFGSKAGIVAAVLERAVEGFSRAQHAVDRDLDPLLRLYVIGQAYRTWALANESLYLVLFSRNANTATGAEASGSRWPTVDARHHATMIAPVRECLRELIDTQVFDEIDLDLAVSSFWSFIHGLVSLEICAPEHFGRLSDEQYTAMALHQVRGFLRPEYWSQLSDNPTF